jgi:hypothetical protein
MSAQLEFESDFSSWSTVQTGRALKLPAATKATEGFVAVASDGDFGPESTPNLVVLSHFQPQRSWIGRSLDHVRHLPPNWDGYGADSLNWLVIRKLGEVLAGVNPAEGFWPANIVPGADGSLQAEWHLPDFSTELCIEADLTVSLARVNRQTGEMTEYVDAAALDAFSRCLEGLRR